MTSFNIDIILLENGFIGVKIFEDENETFQASFNKESTIRTLIEYYEDKKIQEFPKDLLNKLKSQKDENVTIEGDLLINYITGYEENNLALNQKESINIPEIIARPISNPFTIFTFVKKEKALKVLKFARNDVLEELKDYGPSSAYCNGNNFLFISGGENPNNDLISKFFKIDLINAQIETAPMAPKKNHSMIFIQGDYVFIVGGQTKDTFYYDLNGNKFCGWGKLNKNRIEPALILVNNYLYCFDNTNSNNGINEKFTFERSDIYSENHTWEICEPNLSLVKMNQKYFGVSQNNDDIIFIGGSLDLEDEDNINSKERKNLKYNISNNTIEESDIPFIDYNFKEKTFLKYNEKINYILPDFNMHQPEVMFYQKEKNVIRFLKCYSKKKLEEKEKAEKNIRDYSPIKIGFKLNLNQPKENENIESVNININPINVNANLNNEFIKVENENENEKENKNEEIKDLNEEINNENQNEEYKNQEEEYKNENENENEKEYEENHEVNSQKNFENEEQNEIHEKNSENNNLGDDPNNLSNNEQNQDLNIDNYQSNPEEKEENEEDTNNLKLLKEFLEYSKPQLEENVEINEGENQEEIKEDILKGPNINVDVNIGGNNDDMLTNNGNGNLELEGKGNVQTSDINDPKINIQQNIDLNNLDTFVTNINKSQIPKENNPNNQINQDSNIQINMPQPNIEVNPNLNIKSSYPQPNTEINPNINIESNNPQQNISINPGMDTNIKTDVNNKNPQMGTEYGVSMPNAGYDMNGEFLITGIILGTNDNEENFKEMKLKDPNLQIIPPGTKIFINNPNAGFNAQDPNINTNTNIQQPNVNMQGTEINTNIQQSNVNMQGTEINTNAQQPNVNMRGPNVNINAQLPDPGVYNEKGEYVISGFIVGSEEKDPEILKYKKSVNMETDLNMNNNMNADLNAQGNLNNNLPQGGINANENMSGMNPTAPKLDINGNISGGNYNMRKVEVNGPNPNSGGDININLAGQSTQLSNNLNPNVNYKGSQGIRIPNVVITDPRVGGNFTGNLNTNLPSNFDPKAEIKPAEIKLDSDIKPMNVDNCYDAQGNFCLTGIIPSKNDNNLNESINNLSMTNLLLLQSNRVDTKLNRSKLGSSNINQSMMNTNQLNTDLGNDNKVEMNVGLNVIKEDEK